MADIDKRNRLRRCSIAGAYAVAVLGCPPAAAQQSLIMPDFRQQYRITTVKAGERCVECGRVLAAREVALERRTAVPVAFQGSSRGIGEHNLVGAVVYLPLSSSSA